MGFRRLGAIAIVALFCYWVTSSIVGPTKQRELQRDRSGRDYITRAVPEFLSFWDFDEFEGRAAGELKASRDYEAIKLTFKHARKILGKPIKYGQIIGQVTDSFESGYSGEVVTAVYTQKIGFKFEEADLVMSIVKREGGWKFQKLAVRSPALPNVTE